MIVAIFKIFCELLLFKFIKNKNGQKKQRQTVYFVRFFKNQESKFYSLYSLYSNQLSSPIILL